MDSKKELDDNTLDEPVMEGAEQHEGSDKDSRKGQSDPALIRHPEKGDKTVAPYNL